MPSFDYDAGDKLKRCEIKAMTKKERLFVKVHRYVNWTGSVLSSKHILGESNVKDIIQKKSS